ncbi:6690_t:CDS:2, partial [Acaulospora morrowiae]
PAEHLFEKCSLSSSPTNRHNADISIAIAIVRLSFTPVDLDVMRSFTSQTSQTSKLSRFTGMMMIKRCAIINGEILVEEGDALSDPYSVDEMTKFDLCT